MFQNRIQDLMLSLASTQSGNWTPITIAAIIKLKKHQQHITVYFYAIYKYIQQHLYTIWFHHYPMTKPVKKAVKRKHTHKLDGHLAIRPISTIFSEMSENVQEFLQISKSTFHKTQELTIGQVQISAGFIWISKQFWSLCSYS